MPRLGQTIQLDRWARMEVASRLDTKHEVLIMVRMRVDSVDIT